VYRSCYQENLICHNMYKKLKDYWKIIVIDNSIDDYLITFSSLELYITQTSFVQYLTPPLLPVG
jgi:hypothetical protein